MGGLPEKDKGFIGNKKGYESQSQYALLNTISKHKGDMKVNLNTRYSILSTILVNTPYSLLYTS